MERLVIAHQPGESPGQFVVQRVNLQGMRSAASVSLNDPLVQPLAGTDLTLGAELAWYLEHYLDYPFGPHQQRAERVLAALQRWGQEAFEALLGTGQARDFYRDATRQGHTDLHLVISSDDPAVLAWPWEALHDPLVGDLAHLARIERQLNHFAGPLPLPENLPRDRIRILLVTARPYDDDVAYRSVSRPLVEMIHDEARPLPAEVRVLRPPTLRQLRKTLAAEPGGFHVVHFDGHGGFGSSAPEPAAGKLAGPQGRLLFEDEQGQPDPVSAHELSALLREHRIPVVVLNACQSAMLSAEAESEFASVATALLRAGVRSVVAMGYALYVSAARQFLPAFYESLFEQGDVAEATRVGRQALLREPERFGGWPLQDWLVPVLYQQDPWVLDFVRHAPAPVASPLAGALLDDQICLTVDQHPHGLVGRDRAVLALERASRRPPPALLLHGLGGVGKTTLARGYVQWLAQTQGLPERVIWQPMQGVHSLDYLRNRLVEELFGVNALAAPDAQKWAALTQTLRKRRLLIVWDNFESASGSMAHGATEASGLAEGFSAADQQVLRDWLETLRGGQTKFLVTSRSDEHWLGRTACYRVPLGGLDVEERLTLAQLILQGQGVAFDPQDAELTGLLADVQGHPLMMQVLLPRLAHQPAASLRQQLATYVPEADSADPLEQRLWATLRFVENGLPPRLRPLLVPLAWHEGFVYATHLVDMARVAHRPFQVSDTEALLHHLQTAGLVRSLGQNLFELHPALARFLRSRVPPDQDEVVQAWQRGFIGVMAHLADQIPPKPLHEQRQIFARFGGSFEQALTLVAGQGEFQCFGALAQALAFYALTRRQLQRAALWFERLAQHSETHGQVGPVAVAYHQLGVVAQERRDFEAAEEWYRKSLVIKERQSNGHRAAITYRQLGMVEQERWNFEAAEAWYHKSLMISGHQDNEHEAALTYHQLGMVAQKRQDFEVAEEWYRKSLVISEHQGDEDGAASTYHQLGMVAEERRDFEAAEAWYRKSLMIRERLGNEHGAANTYHQMGVVLQERRDFEAAEVWYRKSLVIEERQGNEHGAAITYHQLGMVAEERQDFEAAEAWYRKSLVIFECLGNEDGAASTYHQLGMVAERRCDFEAAEAWYRKSLVIFERLNPHHAATVQGSLARLAKARSSSSPSQQP